MKLFGRGDTAGEYPKADSGKGSLDDYRFSLVPNNARITIVLAGSDPHQDELAKFTPGTEVTSFIAPRTIEEERTDAAMPVRIFADSRMSGVVGWVPRGLEPAVIEAMARLEGEGKPPRIPAEVTATKRGLRLTLLMGLTR
ncbi:hypothetical protein [Galbitalea soli]|uniref:HIRAN domain-containing protein n=1 Tax=Galbitalea soli TaxID=1268042 RepID=A0A7C9PLM6_9MICO|nr:hypothetical protein [Galbitalea soli]NEM90372.1 hypothetical protein [Galbitalea soli]NYJ31082.1 hypothetical protein [Galbitalea soli]